MSVCVCVCVYVYFTKCNDGRHYTVFVENVYACTLRSSLTLCISEPIQFCPLSSSSSRWFFLSLSFSCTKFVRSTIIYLSILFYISFILHLKPFVSIACAWRYGENYVWAAIETINSLGKWALKLKWMARYTTQYNEKYEWFDVIMGMIFIYFGAMLGSSTILPFIYNV